MKIKSIILCFAIVLLMVICYLGITLPANHSDVSVISTDNTSSNVDVSEVSDDTSKESSIDTSTDTPSVPEISDEQSATVSEISDEISEVSVAESSDESSTPTPDKDGVMVVNGLIIYKNRIMEAYSGGTKTSVTYAGYINKFAEYMGDGYNIYSMPIPTSIYLYYPEKYLKYSEQHIINFENVRSNLNESITDINVLPILLEHSDEDLYYHSDHHWNSLGAYYAAMQLANVCGVDFAELNEDNYMRAVGDPYQGSLYDEAGSITGTEDTNFYWYETRLSYTLNYYTRNYFELERADSGLYAKTKNSYTKFLCGDSYAAYIKTDCNNGRVLWLIKDSFGNALPQYLLASFSEIYVVDVRYFKLGAKDFASEHGITDICIALSAFSILNSNGATIQNFIK